MRLKPTACYIRVSTQEQKLHGISLDAQREKLTEYASAHNLQIVEWYADEGVSGKKPIAKRPALQQMIADAEKGKFSHIIFIKLDRFFRSVAEYHECMKRLGDVTWDATEEKYDISTANGRAFVNMKLTIAELEADQTGERIRLVNEYKVKTGQPLHGSMPWSHKIINTADGKRIIVDPDTREQALDVLNYFMSTGLLRQTLYYANQYHSFYDLVGLKRWLQNTMLKGAYRDNENYCEPLISAEDFARIQSMLDTQPKQNNKREYKFSGLLICPVCGRRLVGAYAKERVRGKVYEYKKYKCDNYANKRGCTYKLWLSENMVERCLLEHIGEYIDLTTTKQKLKKKKPVDTKKIKAEMDRLNYMFQKNRIDVADYDRQYTALQEKLKEAPTDTNAEEKLKEMNAIIEQGWHSVYQALDTHHRAMWWHLNVKSIKIHKDGRHYAIEDIEFL
jgi:DNA invertase Pin-like site-specific DNA recombinase